MRLYEAQLDDALLEKLIDFSDDWEKENSTYGYRKNDASDIEGNRIFLAEQDGTILAYLLGHKETAQRSSSILNAGSDYFEIEELYVLPDYRSKGIGQRLFRFAEERVKKDGLDFIMLSTATKNYKRILHFYIEELDMNFWSARLYKKL